MNASVSVAVAISVSCEAILSTQDGLSTQCFICCGFGPGVGFTCHLAFSDLELGQIECEMGENLPSLDKHPRKRPKQDMAKQEA